MARETRVGREGGSSVGDAAARTPTRPPHTREMFFFLLSLRVGGGGGRVPQHTPNPVPFLSPPSRTRSVDAITRLGG